MKRYNGYKWSGLLLLLTLFCACRTAKLSDAEEKQRIGEYYEAAAIYR